VFQRFPMIPALKAAVAHFSGDSSWTTVRPPLVALSDSHKGELIASLDTLGFAMPGLAGEEPRPLAQAPA
jgi:4-hydroxy-tetrahydrodipicolinate synthase